MNATFEIGIAGAGAWGTALASVVARAGHAPLLWAREMEVAVSVNERQENTVFLPGIALPETIRATSDLSALAQCSALLMVVPAQYLRPIMSQLGPLLPDGVPIALCAKGIERGTGELLTEILADVAPHAVPAVLSGPSFAADVAKGLPTAVTLACNDEAAGRRLMDFVGLPTFRPYLSSDLVGAQVGGAVKNVLAIACGIVDGRAFGDSARAALTARGFAEIVRLGTALGARAETLAGLSGLGDLILTCNSRQSRNMSLGVALGEGRVLSEVLSSRNSVAEGVHTASAVMALAERHGIEMPISHAVAQIVGGNWSVDDAIGTLLSRPFKTE